MIGKDATSAEERILRVEETWFHEAPYFSTFLNRAELIESTACSAGKVPTMGIGVVGQKLSLVYNEEYVNSLTDPQLEGMLYHEILHITALNQEREKRLLDSMGLRPQKSLHYMWNVATDIVNNEDIRHTTIRGRKLELPPTDCVRETIEKDGYNGPLLPEHIFWFLYNNAKKCYSHQESPDSEEGQTSEEDRDSSSETSGQDAPEGDESNSGEDEEQENDNSELENSSGGENEDNDEESESEEGKDSPKDGGLNNGNDSEDENSPEDSEDSAESSENEDSFSKPSSQQDGLTPFDDHRLLSDNEGSEDDMDVIEAVINEAQGQSYGNHTGGAYITVSDFQRVRPTVDERKFIHRHVLNFYFSNRGKEYRTWSRRNRRGLPLPGKRKGEAESYVFLDVSGSTFSKKILSRFFNEIDYLAKRRIDIRLITWDTRLRQHFKYTPGLWKNKDLTGGGGTHPQPIFDWVTENGKSHHPVLIFTDGQFNWKVLNYRGLRPFWVFSQNPSLWIGSFQKESRAGLVPVGDYVILRNQYTTTERT